MILHAKLSGEARFSDIVPVNPGLSERLLSGRLNGLESEGIVTRPVMASIPVRVDYGPTEKGQVLNRVIMAVSDWRKIC